MKTEGTRATTILMLSTHGYVAAEPELGRPDTGGQVTFVLELAKRFAALGHRVDIVTRRFEDQPEVDAMGARHRVWRIPFGGRDFVRKEDMHDHLGEFVARFLAEVRERGIRYDIVSSHYWDAGWAGQKIAEELRIPHVHTPHSLGAWKRRGMGEVGGEQEKTLRFEERIHKEFLVFGRCDRVIATSNMQIAELEKAYGLPAEQVALIPPGIDESRFTPVPPDALKALRRKLGFRRHDVYCVGRAATNKGYDLLIRALTPLREIVPDARLQLAVGANSSQDRRLVRRWQELAADAGVASSVDWHAYVEDGEMADWYRAAAVFALPSRYEPFGMTAVEAMACGTPTVVTTHGGLHELIDFGEHALFADPKRPVEFAALLGLALRHERLRRRLAVDGARFARRHFGWKGIAKRTLEVFASLRGRYDSDCWDRRPGPAPQEELVRP
jgi:mannosylfructose-phosphate synthase